MNSNKIKHIKKQLEHDQTAGYSLDTCLFSNKRKTGKGVDLGRKEGGMDLGGIGEGEP